jgi:hypothetical protein
MVVQSDIMVANLNADLLDGLDASDFATASSTYTKAEVDAMVSDRYVPFVARGGGGVCATTIASDTDYIVIDSTGTSGDIQVTSVAFNSPTGTTEIIFSSSVVQVTGYCTDYPTVINGCYAMTTADFVTTSQLGGFEVMGSPLANGGIFARRITASNDGSNDIVIKLFCDADGDDINWIGDGITVAGWKKRGETVTVSYEEEDPLSPP